MHSKKRDFRLTPQRVELVRLIAASEGHPSAAQLYENITTQFPTMSQATVYKTLALLKEMDRSWRSTYGMTVTMMATSPSTSPFDLHEMQ